MATRRLEIPNLLGGVSTQPPAARYINQPAGADNVTLSISDGTTKRQGSQIVVGSVPGYTTGDDVRMEPLALADGASYLLMVGPSDATVYETDGTECYVAASPDALDYLAADPADMRVSAIADSLVLTNTTVELGAETSDSYEADGIYPTFSTLACHAPADGKVFYVREADAANPEGFYRHDVGPGTWATWVGYELTASTWADRDYWTGIKQNPVGITVGFVRFACDYDSVAWSETGLTLTKTGAFSGYTWQAGDHIYIESGTGLTADEAPGWYEIAAKVSDDEILLNEDPSGANASNQTDWSIDGIGPAGQVTWDFRRESFSDIYDVMHALTDAFRSAGFPEALVGWVPSVSSPGAGRIKITSPYRGAGTWIPHPLPPTGDYIDGTKTGTSPAWPFDSATATGPTDGTGTPDSATLALDERWVQVAPPAQADAVLSPSKMPLQLTLAHDGSGYYGDSYDAVVLEDKPWSYWRLGEATGATTATDETGRNDGTYNGGVTLEADSLVERATDTAATFDGTSGYVECGVLTGFGDAASGHGVTLEAWVSMADGEIGTIAGWDGPGQQCTLYWEDPNLYLWISGAAGSTPYRRAIISPAIDDGNPHHIVATWDGGDRFGFYIDGEPVEATVDPAVTLAPWSEFPQEFRIGVGNPGVVPAKHLAATIDDVAVYDYPLTPIRAHLHYRAGVSSAVPAFSLAPIDAATRLSGNSLDNPLPWFWKENKTLSDVGYHRGRSVMAAGPRIRYSQSDVQQRDENAPAEWNFWIADPANLGDSDPIELQVSGSETADITYIVPFRRALLVFTAGAQQYEITADGVLTPSTVVNTPSTTYPADPDVPPVMMGNKCYFASSTATDGQIREYSYDDLQAAHDAPSVSEHVAGYLPVALKTLATASNHNTLFALPTAGDAIYVWRNHRGGDDKLVQSAWSRWTVDDTERVSDIAVVGSELFALIEGASVWQLVKYPLVDEGAANNMPSTVYLDNRRTLTGTNDGSTTTWDFTDADATLDTVVLGGAFDDAGTVVSGTANNGTTLTVADATGAYAGDPCYVGRKFNVPITLSRPYLRDRNNVAILDAHLQIMALQINYIETGGFTVTISQGNRSDRTSVYSPPSGTQVASEGTFLAFIGGDAAETTITLSDDSPYPLQIVGLEYEVDVTRASR